MSYCGGFNPRTGKKVGSRHSWRGGNQCWFCGRWKQDVFPRKPKPKEKGKQ